MQCGKKTWYEGFGEMLFTHFGVSGPLILSASSFYSKNISKRKGDDEVNDRTVRNLSGEEGQ